jgi:hypothetical protein
MTTLSPGFIPTISRTLFGIVTRPWGVIVVIIYDLGLPPGMTVSGLMLINQRASHNKTENRAPFGSLLGFIFRDQYLHCGYAEYSVCID